MTKEPTRSQLEEFITTQYALLVKKVKDSDKSGVTVVLRGAQVAYASTLFYMRTGMLPQSEPEKFNAFLRQMERAHTAAEGGQEREEKGK